MQRQKSMRTNNSTSMTAERALPSRPDDDDGSTCDDDNDDSFASSCCGDEPSSSKRLAKEDVGDGSRVRIAGSVGVGTHAARTFLRGEGGGREGGGGVLTKENTSGDALALAESLNKAPGRLCLWSLEGVLSSRSH